MFVFYFLVFFCFFYINADAEKINLSIWYRQDLRKDMVIVGESLGMLI